MRLHAFAPFGRVSRTMILLGVLALHGAMLAVFMEAFGTRTVDAAAEQPLTVMLLPLSKPPKVRAENLHVQTLSTNVAAALSPPVFNSSPDPESGSSPEGRGATVNWTAEAHRAVRAFEIRRDHPRNNMMLASDDWGSRAHEVGERFKTDSGDWMVWISASCYQVASWQANATALNATAARTICPAHLAASRGPSDPAAASERR